MNRVKGKGVEEGEGGGGGSAMRTAGKRRRERCWEGGSRECSWAPGECVLVSAYISDVGSGKLDA
jgi:hypothetical protein